jgi:hypothetical protein
MLNSVSPVSSNSKNSFKFGSFSVKTDLPRALNEANKDFTSVGAGIAKKDQSGRKNLVFIATDSVNYSNQGVIRTRKGINVHPVTLEGYKVYDDNTIQQGQLDLQTNRSGICKDYYLTGPVYKYYPFKTDPEKRLFPKDSPIRHRINSGE